MRQQHFGGVGVELTAVEEACQLEANVPIDHTPGLRGIAAPLVKQPGTGRDGYGDNKASCKSVRVMAGSRDKFFIRADRRASS